VPAWRIVTGKAAFTAVVASASLVLLTAIGAIFARRLVDPAGFVVLSAAVILAGTGWGAVVYAVARTERQGGTVSSILLLVFAFMGGSFIQLDSLPPALLRLAPFSPFYWGTTGYRALIVEQGGLRDVLPNVAVLALLGTVLLAAGARILERKVVRGVTA
jgi:ABC-type multidrug transport system permease subunit